MTLTTPALLFPAISLLLLAYTNRFLVLAQLIRELNAREGSTNRPVVLAQIDNLKKRIKLIRAMQVWGVFSFLLCTLSMFSLFIEQKLPGIILFGVSLCCLTLSLIISLYEIHISCDAIEIELQNIEKKPTA
ncbi:MAG: II family cellulose-binding protein [Pseudoalteromonas sp.]|nr:II family cellulose-binding protein [Pseudoalteromonas sp.]|tara:strand:- start:6417 stop:6812 length:396 start_codon:yes stop_codon:yes gene_type:complete